MPKTFVEENARSLEKLRNFVERVSNEELSLKVGDNWTVAALLAHLAFWDYRALVLLDRWTKSGIGSSSVDSDVVNDASRPLCLAIAPRAAAGLALSAADAIDHALESARPEMIAAIQADGGTLKLNRWEHRQEHLEEIEQVLNDKLHS